MWLMCKKQILLPKKISAAVVLAAFFVSLLLAMSVLAAWNLRPQTVKGNAAQALAEELYSPNTDLPVQSAAVGESRAAAAASATGRNILVITDSLRANSNISIKKILDMKITRNDRYNFVAVATTEMDEIFRLAQKADKIIINVEGDSWYNIKNKFRDNQPKAAVLDLRMMPEYKWKEAITSL